MNLIYKKATLHDLDTLTETRIEKYGNSIHSRWLPLGSAALF